MGTYTLGKAIRKSAREAGKGKILKGLVGYAMISDTVFKISTNLCII